LVEPFGRPAERFFAVTGFFAVAVAVAVALFFAVAMFVCLFLGFNCFVD
jgi:hypothetical protein